VKISENNDGVANMTVTTIIILVIALVAGYILGFAWGAVGVLLVIVGLLMVMQRLPIIKGAIGMIIGVVLIVLGGYLAYCGYTGAVPFGLIGRLPRLSG
jgi:membrane-bound ClpP family serine protease